MKKIQIQEKSLDQILPRFIARCFDMIVFTLVYIVVLTISNFLIMNIYQISDSYYHIFGRIELIFLIWIFIEPILLSVFGYTPGKWLMHIKVSDFLGKKLGYFPAFKRSFLLWVLGLGMAINLLQLTVITIIISGLFVVFTGATLWDKLTQSKVIHYKKVNSFMLFIVIYFLVRTSLWMFR